MEKYVEIIVNILKIDFVFPVGEVVEGGYTDINKFHMRILDKDLEHVRWYFMKKTNNIVYIMRVKHYSFDWMKYSDFLRENTTEEELTKVLLEWI